MPLDTVTLLIALGVLCCSFGIAMLLIWRVFSPGRPMLLWAVGMLSCGVGSLLVALRDVIPLFFSLIVGNLLFACCFCLVWWGTSLHRGSEAPRLVIAVSLLLFSALFSWFALVTPDMAWRVVIIRSFMAFWLAGAMSSLIKGEKRRTGMERVALATLLLNLLFQLLTVGMQLSSMSSRESLQGNANVALTALLSLAGVTGWGLAVILVKLEKMLEELRESRELFNMIANSSPAMLWMSGLDGKCTWFNETWLSFTGRPLEQELGDGWAEKVHPDDADRCLGTYRESFEARRPFSMEYRQLHHGGDYRWLLDQGHPRHDASGAFCGFIGSCLDVHDRHLADEMLRRKNDEIEQFIYTVSHDLRSPLVTIKSFLGYLEQDMEAADSRRIGQDLHFIHTAADKMEELLVELLELSRISRRENSAQRVTFRELASEALSLLAGHIVDQRVGVRVADVDQPLVGDRPRLVQIWQNLVDNAVKYMGDQPAPLIELGIARQEGEVIFFVRDNGIGIAPEYQGRVFGMFEKLDQESCGVGLGLAMVKRIVEKYNGRIWVDSPGRGGGSCFSFTLPGALLPEGEQ